MLSVMLQDEVQNVDDIWKLTGIYLSFIDYAYNSSNEKFRNFLTYKREWYEREGSEDSRGRTIWALGYTAAYTNVGNFYLHSNHLFKKGLEKIEEITHPRSIAYTLLGLTHHARVHGEKNITDLIERKGEQLYSIFDATIEHDWLWFDNIVTYANSRIPQALISAGVYLNNESYMARGLKILDWLIKKQFVDGIFSPIGNKGWLTPEGKARFDQQPIEAHGMIDACLEAEICTGNDEYGDYALRAFSWFTGDNDCGQPLYDFATGGCRDGLHPDGVNLNQGAESTISWLMSLLNISFYLRDKNS
jgi:hypothetical protein